MSRSLDTYNAKRDFKKTREPAGKPGRKAGNSFMVQKHAASRLHWDFRLELDGVLLSWAVTRPPSADPKVKRLAVRTEDHPLSYATFEGTIPKGEYGGGTVMLWDRGTWENESDPREGLAKGKLHFTLTGERMKGEWVLIRLKPEGKAENWLLGKIADEFATGGELDFDTGVASGLTMDEIAAGKSVAKGSAPTPDSSSKREGSSKAATPLKNKGNSNTTRIPLPEREGLGVGAAKPRAKRSNTPPPPFRDPQLATLVDRPPTGSDWLHETKYDGYRALLAVGGGKCVAYTRSGLDWTAKFKPIADAAAALACDTALIDCEIVALDAGGKPSFGALQANLKEGGPLLAFAFDLLELDGDDLTGLPLTERKERLAHLLEGVGPPIHYSEYVRGSGEKLFEALCAGGYEGVISKQADSRYKAGRGGNWLKSKCLHRQEFVIGGWSTSDKGRGFASLLLGYYEGKDFIYAGRVGTGFDDKTIEDLTVRLAKLKADKPAYAAKLPALARRGANWVKPELVAEVAFTEFTADGHLRHPSFIALRGDKPAKDVVREQAAPLPEREGSGVGLPRARMPERAEVPPPTPPVPGGGKKAAAPKGKGSGVVISSPDRIVFPELGLTKGALAAYYEALAPAMMPDLARRAISLVRCPQGRAKQCFFQKHDSGMFPDSVHSVPIAESDGKTEPYLYVEDAAGLLACVQMGTIEFHGWGSRVDDIERPDRLVIDLDPDQAVSFEAVKLAAELIRERLKSRGLDSAPMLSGGKGVHVVVPLVPKAEWPAVKAWAHAFADSLEAEAPDVFVANMSKAKRKGRIFVDYLRNQRGATAVLPYSVRARAGAGVAVPLSWAELKEVKAANMFSAADVPAVLAHATKRRAKAEARELPD